jgi:hypothetical protein
VFNSDGSFRYSIGAPHSNLLEEGSYKPSKLIVDRRGYIYVIESGGDYRGILLLDHQGTFRGFFEANPVGFSLQRWFARIFPTEEQKKQLSKVRPTHHASIVLDDRGFVYTVLPFASSDQIKKLSQIGTNVYPSGKYGEVEREPSEAVQRPRFIDIAVDEQGIISALDFNSGKIYQYDQNGNFLTVFGGKAWQRGYFGYPASLVAGPGGVLYVLDAERASVDRFRPTEFTRLVHQAAPCTLMKSMRKRPRPGARCSSWTRTLSWHTRGWPRPTSSRSSGARPCGSTSTPMVARATPRPLPSGATSSLASTLAWLCSAPAR